MSDFVNTNRVKEVLNSGMEEARVILDDPAKVESVLNEVGEKLASIPILGNIITELPDMVNLVSSYIKQEYPEVSPKVILSALGAFLYLIKKKDLIPDRIPIIGILDDIAVLGIALEVVKPELNAYREWKAARSAQKSAPENSTVIKSEISKEAAPESSTEIKPEIKQEITPENTANFAQNG